MIPSRHFNAKPMMDGTSKATELLRRSVNQVRTATVQLPMVLGIVALFSKVCSIPDFKISKYGKKVAKRR